MVVGAMAVIHAQTAGQREGGEQHALLAFADAPPQLPQGERGEQRRGERMRPEGDQRLH